MPPVEDVCVLLQALTFQPGRWNICNSVMCSGRGKRSYMRSPHRASASALLITCISTGWSSSIFRFASRSISLTSSSVGLRLNWTVILPCDPSAETPAVHLASSPSTFTMAPLTTCSAVCVLVSTLMEGISGATAHKTCG